MTAIQNGKLEGWPNHLQTEYVDSGSNVDPVHEARHVLKFLLETTGKSAEKCNAMLDELKFTQAMMDGTIGELSGGWQMKLRLAKAVLVDADILLMDEPTNHLVRTHSCFTFQIDASVSFFKSYCSRLFFSNTNHLWFIFL
jgi:elongation factor 3